MQKLRQQFPRRRLARGLEDLPHVAAVVAAVGDHVQQDLFAGHAQDQRTGREAPGLQSLRQIAVNNLLQVLDRVEKTCALPATTTQLSVPARDDLDFTVTNAKLQSDKVLGDKRVVEATLREGKRHVYAKRTFYLDEDSWAALASDEYDARGQLYRTGFAYMAPSYDLPAPYTDMFGHYDLVSRMYSLTGFIAETGGLRHTKPLPDREWTADSLAGAGVR